ncbi:MAG: hypothetical protein AAF251_07565 [Pseudomonadota bacterium]
MDADFFLVVVMVIVTTAITGLTINGVVQKIVDYKREKNAIRYGHSTDAPQITDMSERTDHIEDRLKVLERIATDPEARRGADLADQIEQLRLEQKQKELG